MVVTNSQAEELNRILTANNPAVYELLSEKGKAIYFPRMGILAQGAAAKGKEINATVGTAYEDDGDPMVLQSIAHGFDLHSKDSFPYAPSEGVKPLREKWQELIRTKNPSLDKTEISMPVATCGVTNGLSMAGYMFTGDTDEIIIADLYWENYDLSFTNAYGAELKFFNFFKNRLFEEIINVLSEAAQAGNKLVVMLDDSYFGLGFEEDIMTESLFSELAGCHENLLAVKLDGITKEEYSWGLRVGFVTYGIKNGSKELYRALEDKTAGAIRGNISNTSHPAQSLFLNALKTEEHAKEKERNNLVIKERYQKVKEVIDKHAEYEQYFEALPFNSGYFMCVRLKGLDPNRVWDVLLNKYSTGVVCISEKNLFRIAFASTPAAQIEKLFDNIYAACKDCA
jgi:aspartate/methionine/tyrosine aminotransferase